MTGTDIARRTADGTGSEHDVILRALHVLEAALASPATGREEAWIGRVAHDMAPVVTAVVEHCRSAEAPGGLVRELEVVLGRHHVLTKVSEEHALLSEEAGELLKALADEKDVAAIPTAPPASRRTCGPTRPTRQT